MNAQQIDQKSAAKVLWVYRNIDFFTIIFLVAHLFAIGINYINRLHGGFETGPWFWIPALATVVPTMVTLFTVKGIFRNEVLRYAEMGLIELGTLDGKVIGGNPEEEVAKIESRLYRWYNVMKYSLVVGMTFYISLRIAYSSILSNLNIWIADVVLALFLITMIVMNRSNRRKQH